MGWATWPISEDRKTIIGPCGCELPNSFEGIMQASSHKCKENPDGTS